MDNQGAVLNFPCEFVIKVFGLATNEFETAAIHIVRCHVRDMREDAMRVRPSKDGKYLALSFTVHVNNQEQLDAIYQELTANPHVLMAL